MRPGESALAASRVSVVISTNGRCPSLAKTLEALHYQRHADFEVCVVAGPIRDGTHELLAEASATRRLKAACCDEPNLSRSRNIGIALAAGSFVAFIDDDALPEPVWLEQLLAGFDAPDVAGVSGLVFEPNGRDVQFRFSTCDRFGNARHDLTAPADDAAFPLSAQFPHVMGTNAAFRRDALVAVGGFDEEYEYYLDEADVCCRLVDAGFIIRQRGDAPVHHKFLSGMVRDGEGVTVRRYPILKNQLYFSLVNARRHATMPAILRQAMDFSARHRADLEGHVARGTLHEQVLSDFDADWDRALARALSRGLAEERRLRPAGFFANPAPFLGHQGRPAEGGTDQRRHHAIILPGARMPPASTDETLDEARRLAKDGTVVRAFSIVERPGPAREGVELERGIWMHRVQARSEAVHAANGCERSERDRYRHALGNALDRVRGYYPFDEIEDRGRFDLDRR